MDCLSNVSGAELTALANSIALFISENYSIEDIAKFVAFFTSTADILSLLALDKVENITNDLPSDTDILSNNRKVN